MKSSSQSQIADVYCFPCSGAGASAYAPWRQTFPSNLRLRPLELPGRGARMRESFLRDFDRAVEDLSQLLLHEDLERYVLFGHSLGALLAYACAHAINDAGRAPPAAIVAACSAAPSKRNDGRLATILGDAALIAEMRRLGGTPEEVFEYEDLLRLTLDVLAADFAICASFKYRPRPALPTRMIVVGGREDAIELDALLAWEAEGLYGAEVDMFDGGHFFFKEREALFLDFLTRKLHLALGADEEG